MRNWLRDEYVLLTGASGGIGRELTKRLIFRYGAKVVGVGKSEEKLFSLKKDLGERADDFSFYALDVSQKESWTFLRAELTAKGIFPTLLINNAGVFPPLAVGTENLSEKIKSVLEVNFFSTVYAVETLSPLLKNSGNYAPSIVNVCSSAALCPVVGSAVYSASKSALKGYTEGLQLEEKGRYIGIFYPGTTATDLFRDDENVRGSAMDKIACSPEKMAKKIAKKIRKRKKRGVLGLDAKIMYFLAKIAPVKGPAFLRWVMKISKSKAFKNVN